MKKWLWWFPLVLGAAAGLLASYFDEDGLHLTWDRVLVYVAGLVVIAIVTRWVELRNERKGQ